MRKDSKEKYWSSCGILKKWHGYEWKDFVGDKIALETVRKFTNENLDIAKQTGVAPFLFGDNGAGKSMLLNLSFKDLIEKKYTVQVFTLGSLVTQYASGWTDTEQRRALYRVLHSTDFLGLEEVGKQTTGAAEFVNSILETILRYRLQNKKPVWITSNIHPSKIKDMYSEDVASMLREMCVEVKVELHEGEDYRKTIHEKNKKRFT